MILTSSTAISAPPTEVWATLCDVRRWPDWLPTVDDVTPVAPTDPEAIGARYRVVQPKLGTAEWVVTRWDPDTRFDWRSARSGVTTDGTHVIEDRDGSSQVTLSIEWTGPLAPLVRMFYGRLTQRYLETEARSLHDCFGG